MEGRKKFFVENIEKIVINKMSTEVRETVYHFAKEYIKKGCSKVINDMELTLDTRLQKALQEILKEKITWEDIRKRLLDFYKHDIPESDIQDAVNKCIEKFCTRDLDSPSCLVSGSAASSTETTNVGEQDFIEDIPKSIDMDTLRAEVKAKFRENIEKVSGMQVTENIINETVPYTKCMGNIKNCIVKTTEDIMAKDMDDDSTMKHIENIVMKYIKDKRYAGEIEHAIYGEVEHDVTVITMKFFEDINYTFINILTTCELGNATIKVLMERVQKSKD